MTAPTLEQQIEAMAIAAFNADEESSRCRVFDDPDAAMHARIADQLRAGAATLRRVDALEAENAALAQALSPFAKIGSRLVTNHADDCSIYIESDDGLTFGHFYRARDLLAARRAAAFPDFAHTDGDTI